MVRALLDGRKSHTRRVVKPAFGKKHPILNLREHGSGDYSGDFNDPTSWGYPFAEDGNDMPLAYWLDLSPYGQPGDLLWVRETIERAQDWGGLGYPADGRWLPNTPWTWKRDTLPSIHMPRRASRLTLELTGVRVERLQDISEADALAEGITRLNDFEFICPGIEHENKHFPRLSRGSARDMYAALWDTINGSGQWLGNPWVWTLEFRVHQVNVDTLLKARAA